MRSSSILLLYSSITFLYASCPISVLYASTKLLSVSTTFAAVGVTEESGLLNTPLNGCGLSLSQLDNPLPIPAKVLFILETNPNFLYNFKSSSSSSLSNSI